MIETIDCGIRLTINNELRSKGKLRGISELNLVSFCLRLRAARQPEVPHHLILLLPEHSKDAVLCRYR